MPTKQRRSRKSRKRSRKSCKYGKLKRPIKTKSGRKRRCKKKSKRGRKKSKSRRKKSKRGRKSRKRRYKVDALPVYEEIETLPPQYYAPELERVMNRNNMLEDLLERTQESCTNRIAQLNYENEVLGQRLAWEQAQRAQQQGQGYAYVDEEDDERGNEQIDREDTGDVRTRLFDEGDDGDDGDDGDEEDTLSDLENRLNESVGITIRHDVGSPDNLTTYEIDTPSFQRFLNEIVGRYYKMKRRTLESIINYIGMNPNVSNVSRCVKLLMIYSLCVIHSFYTALIEDTRRNPDDLPYTNPDEYLYRNYLRRTDESPSNMEKLMMECSYIVEMIVNDLEDDLTVEVDVDVDRNGFIHKMNPNAIEADTEFIDELCQI